MNFSRNTLIHCRRRLTRVRAQELRGSKVSVTSVQPGHVGTRIMKNASKSSHVVVSEYSGEFVKAYAQRFEFRARLPQRQPGSFTTVW